MTDLRDVDAVVVTRGGRCIDQVLDSLRAFRRTIVWDNSKFPNLMVYGRYVAATTIASSHLVYAQDDDVVLTEAGFYELLGAWRPGSIATNFPRGNRVNYENKHGNVALVGFGSIWEPTLVGRAFGRYLQGYSIDDLFLRECDRVFTALNSWTAVDVKKRDMPWAGGPESMEAERRHGADLELIKGRIKDVEDRWPQQ